MHFPDRFSSPLGQTFGPTANPALYSGSFVQCPAALLQGMTEEQKSELAALYQKAFEQACENIRRQKLKQRRFRVPIEALPGIGWN